ncbi:MAG: ABC transporter ATP-binding protein/permease [Spirochaetes bacterium]|nr:ABC transporter ATP-binding protein/permease [Spirochaetota bacterium]MBU0953975.1 ABC transporter ATP-binding protein/permease [Spirochaetota bacterium]
MIKEFRTLGPYLKQYWYRYVLGIACLLVVDSAQLLIPQYIRRAIDTVAAGNSQAAVGLIVLYLIGTAALIAAGRFLWRYFIHGASRRIEKAMRDRLFSKLMVLPMSFFQTNTVGDLMARATNDMQNIRMASGMAFVALFDGVFMSLAILIVMFAQNPLTAAWILIPLPLITLMIVFFGSAMGRLFKKVQEHYSNMSTVVQETLQGIRVVKSFVKEDHFSTRFSAANDHYREASMRVVKLHGLFFPLITFLAGVTTLLLLLAGGAAVLENRMTPGNLAAMLAYLEMMIWPIMGAGFTVNMIQRGAVSLKRINDILKQDSEVSCALPGGNCPEVPSGDIELRQLSFAYSADSKAILEDVSLRLPAGQTLGILGRIGSGKSTLLRLLTRVIEAPAGSVYIGGLDIGGCSLNSLRSKLGMVPQESFLFSDSIRNNVLFACPDLAENRFREVLRISALERDLELFANGWDTVVGERGLTLSGGQKQRVAIARALAREPEILIFDDALSAVDTATEEQILSAIIADRLGKTNILVSNRVSTLQRADLIAVLDEGRLVQFGTPAELIQQEGFFAETAAMQELSRQQPAGQV